MTAVPPAPTKNQTKPVTIALAGNPNSGKTTLFNALTGSRQHVGNYPGVTVEKKTGRLKHKGRAARVVDLPGTYSLTAYSVEERVAQDFIVSERPDLVVVVLDATNLERNLYLGVQLMEMGVPLVLALNMSDMAQRRGIRINARELSQRLGVPVVPIVATRRTGLEDLLDAAFQAADAHRDWTPLEVPYDEAIATRLEALTARIREAGLLQDRFAARWLAVKLLEGDEQVTDLIRAGGPASAEVLTMASAAHAEIQARFDDDPGNLLSDGRYLFIAGSCADAVQRDQTGRRTTSDRIDQVATHRLLGPAIMLTVLYLLYWFTFTLAEGEILAWAGLEGSMVGWTESFFALLGGIGEAILPDGLLQSLVVDGVIAGVGGVMGFVPIILLMFMGVAILEDSGYMARIAFILDRVMRAFGLHGNSVLALIISGGIAGGCAVPGVLATRTLRDRKERFATIMVSGLFNCGAKLPVYAVLIAAFFTAYKAQVMFTMTVLAWFFAMLAAWAIRKTLLAGPSAPFVMELPPYRVPTVRGVLIHMWERTWMYIRKAGKIIVMVSIVIWALLTFPQIPESQLVGMGPQEAQSATLAYSAAGRLGEGLAVVFDPLGFDWRTNIALIGGFAAKEVIVSTWGIAYSLGEVDEEDSMVLSEQLRQGGHWTPLKACALLVFVLLYAPCMSTIGVTIKETQSWSWGFFALAYPTIMAWAVAFSVYQGGRMMGFE